MVKYKRCIAGTKDETKTYILSFLYGGLFGLGIVITFFLQHIIGYFILGLSIVLFMWWDYIWSFYPDKVELKGMKIVYSGSMGHLFYKGYPIKKLK